MVKVHQGLVTSSFPTGAGLPGPLCVLVSLGRPKPPVQSQRPRSGCVAGLQRAFPSPPGTLHRTMAPASLPRRVRYEEEGSARGALRTSTNVHLCQSNTLVSGTVLKSVLDINCIFVLPSKHEQKRRLQPGVPPMPSSLSRLASVPRPPPHFQHRGQLQPHRYIVAFPHRHPLGGALRGQMPDGLHPRPRGSCVAIQPVAQRGSGMLHCPAAGSDQTLS